MKNKFYRGNVVYNEWTEQTHKITEVLREGGSIRYRLEGLDCPVRQQYLHDKEFAESISL